MYMCVFPFLPQGSPGKRLWMFYTAQQDCRACPWSAIHNADVQYSVQTGLGGADINQRLVSECQKPWLQLKRE